MKSLRVTHNLNISVLLLAAVLAAPACTFAVAPAAGECEKFGDATPLEWSARMARSEMARRGDTLFYPHRSSGWDYTHGFLSRSLILLGQRLDDAAMAAYGAKIAESFITPEGGIATYKPQDYNLDLIPPGRTLLMLYEQTHDERLKKAVELLRRQFAEQPRTSEGGFWHKKRYPYQMWLDGLFMGSTFYAQYGKVFSEDEDFDDVAKQIMLMDKHAYDPKTGLHYHAWDEKHEQSWANKETGVSPNFWGLRRGLVCHGDRRLPRLHPTDSKRFRSHQRNLPPRGRRHRPLAGSADRIVVAGARPGTREGNYREATASCMFVYALAKGINRGYLSREKYLPAVKKGYAGIVRDLLRTGEDGRLNLVQCCSVAGLGFTSSKGRPRDGTFEYYISEPIVENDLKGIPPSSSPASRFNSCWPPTSRRPPLFRRDGWADAEAILARIKAPAFPDRDFPIADFGAVAGGADCTEAIAKAIEAANAAGGGRVVVPAGEWHTGAIRLKSNVNLHIAEGATLKFFSDPAKYPIVFTRWEGVECMNYSPLIYAWEQENIAVTGKGTLDGSASVETWWGWNRKGGANPSRASRGPQTSQRDGREGRAGRTARVRRRLLPAPELHPALPLPERTGRGCQHRQFSDVGNPSGAVHQCDRARSQDQQPRAQQRRLRPRVVPRRADRGLRLRHGRRLHRHQVGPQQRWPPHRRAIGELRHPQLHDERRPRRRGHRQRDFRRLPQRLCRELHDGQPQPRPRAAHQDQCQPRRHDRERVHAQGEGRPRGRGRVDDRLALRRRGQGQFPAHRPQRLDRTGHQFGQPAGDVHTRLPGATIDDIKFTDCTFKGITTTEVLEGAGTVTLKNVTIEPAKKSRRSIPPPPDPTPALTPALN